MCCFLRPVVTGINHCSVSGFCPIFRDTRPALYLFDGGAFLLPFVESLLKARGLLIRRFWIVGYFRLAFQGVLFITETIGEAFLDLFKLAVQLD